MRRFDLARMFYRTPEPFGSRNHFADICNDTICILTIEAIKLVVWIKVCELRSINNDIFAPLNARYLIGRKTYQLINRHADVDESNRYDHA